MSMHRLLRYIMDIRKEHDLDVQGDCEKVTRKITEVERRKLFVIAKKFVQGMEAGQAHHGMSCEDFLPRFAKWGIRHRLVVLREPKSDRQVLALDQGSAS